MSDDEKDVLWRYGSLLSVAAIDGGPAGVLGRLPPSLRVFCQLWAWCESLMLLQCLAQHIIVSQGQTQAGKWSVWSWRYER